MADSSLVEGIKLIGGILGIATAIFTVWERLLKNRPQIDIEIISVPDMIKLGMSEVMGVDVHLRIYNPSDKTIAIKQILHNAGTSITIPFYSSLNGYVRTQMGMKDVALIRPKSERTFEIAYVEGLNNINNDTIVKLSVKWHPVNSIVKRMPLYFRFKISDLSEYRRDEWNLKKIESERPRH